MIFSKFRGGVSSLTKRVWFGFGEEGRTGDGFKLIYSNEQPDLIKSVGYGSIFVISTTLIDHVCTYLLLPLSIIVKKKKKPTSSLSSSVYSTIASSPLLLSPAPFPSPFPPPLLPPTSPPPSQFSVSFSSQNSSHFYS